MLPLPAAETEPGFSPPPPEPEPPFIPGFPAATDAPPPADVIVENTELLPLGAGEAFVGGADPPPPTVTGNVVAVIVIPVGDAKGDVCGDGIQVSLEALNPPAPAPLPATPLPAPPPATTI